MAPKPAKRKAPTVPDAVSITGTRRSTPGSVDGRTPDPGKEQDARMETYEQEVERASIESVAEHPEGSAPALERLVDAHPEQQKKP
jgi:hypothetical protein